MADLNLTGQRVYFKRQGMAVLRAYWGRRWDSPTIREAVTRSYTPRYWVEREELGGVFLKLQRIDLLWYRGLFSLGRHLPSGRYIQAPIAARLRGMGPRQLVFPTILLQQLDGLQLIGRWRRYLVSAGLDPVPVSNPWQVDAEDRVELAVERFCMATPPPILDWRGEAGRDRRLETACVAGVARNTPLAGRRLVVPVSEVFWNQFHAEGAAWW